MLLNSGNPNLTDSTRFLVNDPTTAANNLYSVQEVKDAINLAYFDVFNELVSCDPSWGFDSDYADTVLNQTKYAFPSDAGQILEVLVEYDGKNIISDSTASPQRLQKVPYRILEEARRAGQSGVYYWAIFKQHFTIYPLPTTAGTSSLYLTFVVDPTALSGDTDKPVVPTTSHKLITVKAAIYLLMSRNLDTSELRNQEYMLTQNLYKTAYRNIGDTDQFQTSAIVSYSSAGKMGTVG